jgi:hypothetical protein
VKTEIDAVTKVTAPRTLAEMLPKKDQPRFFTE